MSLGISELILITVVILVLFGGKRIPELARALGKASYEFKKAKESLQQEVLDFKETVENTTQQENNEQNK